MSVGESDRAKVPRTQGKSDAGDPGEGRARQGGATSGGHMGGAQKPKAMSPELRRIAEKAREDHRVQFTSLAHLLTVEALEAAWKALKKRSGAGIDGVTAAEYERDLRGNLERLHERLRAGQYVAPPVRRSYVPKEGAGLRPIGVPTIEDKIAQAAVARILSAIYEQDFLPCSYGFRPGRSPHDALDALNQAIIRGKVNWVFDADISAFFDRLDKGVLRRFLEHRVKDRSLLRLIAKWLHAGVLEDGVVYHPETGTPQGGVISPILANVYLHYALDLWAERVMRRQLRGEFYLVRYADDVVFAFQYPDDAARFAEALRARLGKFGLRLNDAKTRLIEFGRFAKERGARRNQKPETFDFLGLNSHLWDESHGAVYGPPSDRLRAVAAGDQSGRRVVPGAPASLGRGPVAVSVQRASWALSVLRGDGEFPQPEGLSAAAHARLAEVVGPSEPAGAHVLGALCGCAAPVSAARGVGAAVGVPTCLTGQACL